MITVERFKLLEAAVRTLGYGPTIDWTQSLAPPVSAEEFAGHAVYVICNSGMANAVATVIYNRCMTALDNGTAVATVFGHPGKASAIEYIWRERDALYADYEAVEDKAAMLRSLPWIGGITSLHLAKNLGADVAKPDVHMERLARTEGTTTEELCARLARETGYRAATIDTILWRACAERVLRSGIYEAQGWDAAFTPPD